MRSETIAKALQQAAEVIRRQDEQMTAKGRGMSLNNVPGFEGMDFPDALEHLSREAAEIEKLLWALVGHETNVCRYDHHGTCQEHPGGMLDGRCVTFAARELLRR